MASISEHLKRFWERFIANPEPPTKSLFHTFWHLLGTLLPLGVVFLLTKLYSVDKGVQHFIEEGEFCILSAAVLTPASYILSQYSRTKDQKVWKIPSIIYGISIAIILAASILFTAVYMGKLNALEIDKVLVSNLSVLFLIISAVIFFAAYWIHYESEQPKPDSKVIEDRNVKNINTGFDNLP